MISLNRESPSSTTILLGDYNTARIRLYISYSTIVAVRVFHSGDRETFQRIKSPSQTTSRHMRAWGVGLFTEVSTDTLDQTVRQAMMEIGLGLIGPQWAESAKKAA